MVHHKSLDVRFLPSEDQLSDVFTFFFSISLLLIETSSTLPPIVGLERACQMDKN
jgi:hypothetical protein